MRQWRAGQPAERLREVHHTRESLPAYVRQMILDIGKHLAEQAGELQSMRARIEQLEAAATPLMSDDLPRFLSRSGPAAPTMPEPQATSVIDQQIRYELAVQALNGSAHAIDLMAGEAAGRGTTVALLAAQIVNDRRAAEARVAVMFAEQQSTGE